MRATEPAAAAFGAGSFLSGLSNLKIKFSFLDLFRCLSLSACDFPVAFFLSLFPFLLLLCIFRLASVELLSVGF